MDELHAIIRAYEMRTYEDEKPTRWEARFKSSRKIRDKGNKDEEGSGDDSYVEEANFVRKLKRGTKRYKGKLAFKCFNFGKIGHYSKKCPFEPNKFFPRKNNLYSKEYNSSSDDNDEEECGAIDVIFISHETQNDDHQISEEDETDAEEDCTNMRQELLWETEDDIEIEEVKAKLKEAKEESA